MSYNKTYSEIKQILKDNKKISKMTMVKVAKMAIIAVSYTHLTLPTKRIV